MNGAAPQVNQSSCNVNLHCVWMPLGVLGGGTVISTSPTRPHDSFSREHIVNNPAVWWRQMGPASSQHLQAKISATLLTVIWSSFLCYRWLSQAFPIKASLCTVYASERRARPVCGETVNMPVCLCTMCLCEFFALRWRERSGCY